MAIFKAPRITTSEREQVIFELSEIVFDIDNQLFYTGDDVTLGGKIINAGIGKKVKTHTITQQNVLDGYLILDTTPQNSNEVELEFINGTSQVLGVDFSVSGNLLHWNGLGLDNFIEENDILIIRY